MDVVDCPGLVAAAAKGRPENVAAQTAQLVRRFVVDGWCPGGPGFGGETGAKSAVDLEIFGRSMSF